MNERDVIVRYAIEEAARRRLLDYCARMIPGFDRDAAHVRLWCDLLERVERVEVKRLILTAPPGHGKSTVTQAWVSWFLGRRPRRRVLLLSASEKLTNRNSRSIRAHVQDERYPFDASALSTEAVGEGNLRTAAAFVPRVPAPSLPAFGPKPLCSTTCKPIMGRATRATTSRTGCARS